MHVPLLVSFILQCFFISFHINSVEFICILQHVLFGLLQCHLFALLTYFVCLRNCFPAAKQHCTIPYKYTVLDGARAVRVVL